MQKALGITADGVYGPTTDAALKGKAKDVVVQIQTELAKYGYYTGPIDGKYGSATADAVKRLQSDLGVDADGRVGPETVDAFPQGRCGRDAAYRDDDDDHDLALSLVPGIQHFARVSDRATEVERGKSRSPMRILLVDDEPALRELRRVTFESADVTVDEAADTNEADERIAAERPDLIILDLRLPGECGVEYCDRLKAGEATREIPIVMLTGAEPEVARRAQGAGAEAPVHKPFSPLELLALVERLAAGKQTALRRPRPAGRAHEELILYARDLRHLLEVERQQRELLQQSYLDTVSALATALETDTGTSFHSQRVQRYALELLRLLDADQLEHEPGLEYGFLLHDIGKIGIPDEILGKPGPLTPTERERMQTHTVLGEQMLQSVALLQGAGLSVVRSHHERWDGRGYPDGLRGARIPLGARVFAVADALDAMTSDRPYRRACGWAEAHDEIVAQAGRQFDPAVVEAFARRERALRKVQRKLAVA